MAYGFGGGLSGYNYNSNQSFICHIKQFLGETVTIFTTSGGASGCGFSGVLLAVNCEFVRISTQQGMEPANPLSQEICGGYNGIGGDCNTDGDNYNWDYGKYGKTFVGSVCDIPIEKIAAFCHNAI